MDLYGAWSEKPQLGLGNPCRPQQMTQLVYFDLHALQHIPTVHIYYEVKYYWTIPSIYLLSPWMDLVVKTMTKEARAAIKERRMLGNKQIVKVSISKTSGRKQVSASKLPEGNNIYEHLSALVLAKKSHIVCVCTSGQGGGIFDPRQLIQASLVMKSHVITSISLTLCTNQLISFACWCSYGWCLKSWWTKKKYEKSFVLCIGKTPETNFTLMAKRWS